MIETATLAFFVTASLLLIVAPGPDIVFLVSQGATRGPRAGLATALGLAVGNLVHTSGAVLGVSVIFRTSAVAFQAVKLAGVAYLLWLAWTTVRGAPGAAGPARAAGTRSLVWRGFLMNVLNPKVALFFLAFLPQFVSPAAGPVWAQLLAYGALFTGLVALVFGAVGVCAGTVHGWLAGRGGGRAGRVAAWIAAAVYVALAARLALVEP